MIAVSTAHQPKNFALFPPTSIKFTAACLQLALLDFKRRMNQHRPTLHAQLKVFSSLTYESLELQDQRLREGRNFIIAALKEIKSVVESISLEFFLAKGV